MNSAIPEIVNRPTGPRPATAIVSPTAKPCLPAVPTSIATSCDPDGQRPSVSRERVEARLGRVDADAERRVVRRDRLAVLVDQARDVHDSAGGGLDFG